jgi:hypothetical protein
LTLPLSRPTIQLPDKTNHLSQGEYTCPIILFRGNLAKLDRDVYELTQLEAERQARKLILIPSESPAPMAVREALSPPSRTSMPKATPKKSGAG